MLIPYSKSRLKLSSIRMVQIGIQTLKLQDPAGIRLPSCSALYSETMYKVDSSFQNIYANRYKMETEKLRMESLKRMKEIQALKIEKQKLSIRLTELTIAYNLIWDERKKNKAESDLQTKRNRSRIMSQTLYGQTIEEKQMKEMQKVQIRQCKNRKSSVFAVSRNRKHRICTEIQRQKQQNNNLLKIDYDNMIDQQLKSTIHLKEVKIDELKTDIDRLQVENNFYKKHYDQLLQVQLQNKELSQKDHKIFLQKQQISAKCLQMESSLKKAQKQLQYMKENYVKKSQEEEYSEKLKKFTKDIKISQQNMKNFLKEANIEKKLKNQTIDSMYQENLSYFMFTLKKSEKKYAEKQRQWNQERRLLQKQIQLREDEIEKFKFKNSLTSTKMIKFRSASKKKM